MEITKIGMKITRTGPEKETLAVLNTAGVEVPLPRWEVECRKFSTTTTTKKSRDQI